MRSASAGASASRLSKAKTSRCGRGAPTAPLIRRPSWTKKERAAAAAASWPLRERRAGRALSAWLRAADALGHRGGVLGGRLRLGRQRSDPLVEPRRAGVEFAPALAQVLVEQPQAAEQQRGEAEGAPEIDQQQRKHAERGQRLWSLSKANRHAPAANRRAGRETSRAPRSPRRRIAADLAEREGQRKAMTASVSQPSWPR